MWLRKNRPEDYERINVALFPKDYLRYRMTGEIATDVSDASCSWLLDMKKRAWSDRMFEVTGIPRSIVPERCWRASRRPDVCFRSWLSAGDCVQGSPWRRAAAIKR